MPLKNTLLVPSGLLKEGEKMKRTINVVIRDKIAAASDQVIYVCGNSDFIINFDFDEEWNEFTAKTARFIHNGGFTDVVFEGNQCAVPIISNTHNIKIGVYAGDLRTTTPAYISAKKSILCGGGFPASPVDDVYNQIMDMINGMLARIEALENGGRGGSNDDFTTSILGTAVLGNMILGG